MAFMVTITYLPYYDYELIFNLKNHNNKINNRRRIKAFPPGSVFVNPSFGLVPSWVQLPTSPLP